MAPAAASPPPLPADPPGVPLEDHRSCPVIARLLDDDAARAWLAPLSVHGGCDGFDDDGGDGGDGNDYGGGGGGRSGGGQGGGGRCADEPTVALSLEAFEAATAVSVVVRTEEGEGEGEAEEGAGAGGGSRSVTLHCLVRR